jgi:hypothetical protein
VTATVTRFADAIDSGDLPGAVSMMCAEEAPAVLDDEDYDPDAPGWIRRATGTARSATYGSTARPRPPRWWSTASPGGSACARNRITG